MLRAEAERLVLSPIVLSTRVSWMARRNLIAGLEEDEHENVPGAPHESAVFTTGGFEVKWKLKLVRKMEQTEKIAG